MYQAYWELTCRPFENCSDPRFYYPSEAHQGTLLKLRYAIENRLGAALLAGPPGVGKTMLAATLARQIGSAYAPIVHVVFPQMTSRELLAYITVEIGAAGGGLALSVDESVRKLQRFLQDNTAEGRHAVLVIDEAQLLTEPGLLETLRLLLNFEAAGRQALSLLLVGEPMTLPVLERAPMFDSRLGVKCLLRPLSLEETASYVNHRLTVAGATREIFTPDAVGALHQMSRGAPRQINRLCDLALLIGYAEEQASIGETQIEAVASELVTVSSD